MDRTTEKTGTERGEFGSVWDIPARGVEPLGFARHETIIHHPFYDPSGRDPVDPSEYGFKPVQMGGGCEALFLVDDDGHEVYLTNNFGTGQPISDELGWMMAGRCAETGDQTWMIHRQPDGSVEYEIDHDLELGKPVRPLSLSDEQVRIHALAVAFSAVLRRTLPPHVIEEVLRKNDRQENPSICHTHDYCDANEVMAEAWAIVFDEQPDVGDDLSTARWSAAWQLARANRFVLKL